MSTSLLFKTKTLAVAVSSVILVACGGSSSSNSGGSTPPPSALKGRAVDGPLSGSTVTFEDCGKQTAQTNAAGYFDFPANCATSAITITGGTDTTTDQVFSGVLKAPAVSASAGQQITVSPLTTLIAAAGPGQAANIAKALGLEGVDLLKVDPLSNKDLYAKTVAAQQLIEEIQQTILSLGGNLTPEQVYNASIAAVATAVSANTGADPLTNPTLIAAALGSTLETVKADLPQNLQANLSNVKENLASLTAEAIASNVAQVEDAVTSIPNFSSSIEAIKTATKDAVVGAKESALTEKLVDAVAAALVLVPSDVAASLEAIGSSSITGGSSAADTIEAALNTINQKAGSSIVPTDIADSLADPNAFFANYLKLNGYTVKGTNYTVAALNQSLTTPIKVTSLDDLTVKIAANGSYKGQSKDFTAALKLDNSRQTLVITTDKLKTTYNSAGDLSSAVIPVGAKVKSTSTQNSLATEITVQNTDVNVLSNGAIALNTNILRQLSPALVTQLDRLNVKGDVVTAVAVIHAGTSVVAIDGSNNKPVVATKYTLSPNASGSGVTAKFEITQ